MRSAIPVATRAPAALVVIDATLAFAHDEAAGDRRADLGRKIAQPLDADAIHRFGIAKRFVGEAAQKRLGQHDEIALPFQRARESAVVRAIRGRVVPARCALNQ